MRIVNNFFTASFILIITLACNKNPHELPVKNGSLKMRSVAVEVSGFPVIEFLLEQTVLGTSTVRVGDTIWISIRNRSNFDLNSLGYILELCHRDSVDYDGCVTFYNQQFVQTLKQDSISTRLHSIVNRNFDLESVEVVGGVISINGKSNNSLAGVYGSGYASFQTDTAVTTTAFYGFARGFILSDGEATFRFKSSLGLNYNADGVLIERTNYTGLFSESRTSQSLFRLDTLQDIPVPILINTSNPNEIGFRMKLTRRMSDSIRYVSVLSKKTF